MVNYIAAQQIYILLLLAMMTQFVIFLPPSAPYSKVLLNFLTLASFLLFTQSPSVGRASAIPGFKNIKYYFLL